SCKIAIDELDQVLAEKMGGDAVALGRLRDAVTTMLRKAEHLREEERAAQAASERAASDAADAERQAVLDAADAERRKASDEVRDGREEERVVESVITRLRNLARFWRSKNLADPRAFHVARKAEALAVLKTPVADGELPTPAQEFRAQVEAALASSRFEDLI